uniref:Peptidase_M24 domain-containing protein n=1 Tax=Glossina pallidipes TaxID=7398 RepID=A0A1A9ZFJ2_GLOPL
MDVFFDGLSSDPFCLVRIEKCIFISDLLPPMTAERRIVKTPEGIEVLSYVGKVSADAHIKVMQFMCSEHYQCCAATNNIIKNDDKCISDMRANYGSYAADIACSCPNQKLIYNAVSAARNAVLTEANESVSQVDMHRFSCRVMEKLRDGRMLKSNVNNMLSAGLPTLLRLRCSVRLYVHDVEGYLENQLSRPIEEWLEYLKFPRIHVTVENGCYFKFYCYGLSPG